MSQNPMVPDPNWSQVAAGYDRARGRQVLLCAVCVTVRGDSTPPAQVIVHNGESTCLEHLDWRA